MLGLVSLMDKIMTSITQEQAKVQKELSDNRKLRENERFQILTQIKNEIVYCVGNCVLGINDALYAHSIELLSEAIKQGAIKILVEAIDFNFAFTDSLGIKVALEGLHRYFKHFKSAKHSSGLETSSFAGLHDQLKEEFEFQLNALDALERCQYHYDKGVFKMSQKLLLKHFEPEPVADANIQGLIGLLDQMNPSSQPKPTNRNDI
jgi:hypothetical protein